MRIHASVRRQSRSDMYGVEDYLKFRDRKRVNLVDEWSVRYSCNSAGCRMLHFVETLEVWLRWLRPNWDVEGLWSTSEDITGCHRTVWVLCRWYEIRVYTLVCSSDGNSIFVQLCRTMLVNDEIAMNSSIWLHMNMEIIWLLRDMGNGLTDFGDLTRWSKPKNCCVNLNIESMYELMCMVGMY